MDNGRVFMQEEDRKLREPISEEEFYVPSMRVLKSIGLENIFIEAAKAEKCGKCGDSDNGRGNGEWIKGKWFCEYCKEEK